MNPGTPTMSTRDIKMGTIVDAISWAKHTVLVVMATPSGSPERRAKLDELARATAMARRLADEYDGRLSAELRIALRVAEFALGRLARPPSPDPGSSTSPGQGPDRRRARRRHPRRGVPKAGR